MTWWGVVVAGLLVLAGLGAGVWLAGPSIRSLFGPSFSPSPKDDESVFRAQQSDTITGGGASAGM